MGQGGRGHFSCYPGRASPGLQITEKEWTRADMPSSSFMADRSPTSSEASTSGSAPYIEHTVSKLDTLAGIAIKYGLEVADVKRFNGLTTDLQMFALKILRIPTPGRHPPSAALTSPTQSRCENFTPRSRLDNASGYDLSLPSSGKHKAVEGAQDTSSTMDLLRGYYGLPPMLRSGTEGLEMATLSSGKETDLDDEEAFLPMCRPPNANQTRRYSIGDFRGNRCGYVRESCNHLLDCWSVHESELSTGSSRPVKARENLIKEADSHNKERPIRRRTRSDFGSFDTVFAERENAPKGNPASRPKDSSSPAPSSDWHSVIEVPLGSSGMKTIGAALLGGKEAMEGLLSKVMHSATSTASQEGGKQSSERLSSTGSFSVLEGLTSVYRQAKAALD